MTTVYNHHYSPSSYPTDDQHLDQHLDQQHASTIPHHPSMIYNQKMNSSFYTPSSTSAYAPTPVDHNSMNDQNMMYHHQQQVLGYSDSSFIAAASAEENNNLANYSKVYPRSLGYAKTTASANDQNSTLSPQMIVYPGSSSHNLPEMMTLLSVVTPGQPTPVELCLYDNYKIPSGCLHVTEGNQTVEFLSGVANMPLCNN